MWRGCGSVVEYDFSIVGARGSIPRISIFVFFLFSFLFLIQQQHTYTPLSPLAFSLCDDNRDRRTQTIDPLPVFLDVANSSLQNTPHSESTIESLADRQKAHEETIQERVMEASFVVSLWAVEDGTRLFLMFTACLR